MLVPNLDEDPVPGWGDKSPLRFAKNCKDKIPHMLLGIITIELGMITSSLIDLQVFPLNSLYDCAMMYWSEYYNKL